MRRFVTAVVVLGVVAGLGAAGASAATSGTSGWSPDHLLNRHVLEMGVHVNGRGDTVASWHSSVSPSETAVQVATKPAGGVWSRAVSLDTGADIAFVVAGVDAAGRAVVAWWSRGRVFVAMHARRAARWTQPRVVPRVTGADIETFDVSSTGFAALGYLDNHARATVVVMRPDGSWRAPVAVSAPPNPGTEGDFSVNVVIGDRGDVTAGWYNETVYNQEGPGDGHWERGGVYPDNTAKRVTVMVQHSANGFWVASSVSGRTIAFYDPGEDGAPATIRYRLPTGSWHRHDFPAQNFQSATVAVRDGSIVTWLVYSDSTSTRIMVSSLDAGTWSTPSLLRTYAPGTRIGALASAQTPQLRAVAWTVRSGTSKPNTTVVRTTEAGVTHELDLVDRTTLASLAAAHARAAFARFRGDGNGWVRTR